MEIINAQKEHLEEIMGLLEEGSRFLKANDVNQWQGNYPNQDVVLDDIEKQQNYIAIIDGEVAGTIVLTFIEEVAYNKIEGKWLSDKPYGTIHRIAVSSKNKGQGIGQKLFDFCDYVCKKNSIESIRVDTHEKNTPMQRLIITSGYENCGTVIQSGGLRMAFEKLL